MEEEEGEEEGEEEAADCGCETGEVPEDESRRFSVTFTSVWRAKDGGNYLHFQWLLSHDNIQC